MNFTKLLGLQGNIFSIRLYMNINYSLMIGGFKLKFDSDNACITRKAIILSELM